MLNQVQKDHKNSTTQTGELKKKYKDLPRFEMINEYENEFKKEYEETLKEMNKDLVKKFYNFMK